MAHRDIETLTGGGKMDEKAKAEIKQVWGSQKESDLSTIYKVYSRGVQV